MGRRGASRGAEEPAAERGRGSEVMAPAEEVDLGDALEELKSLLRIEDPCSPLDDKVLRRFLVARKGNAVKACEMYKAYLAYRRRTPRVQDEDVRVGLSHKKTFLVPRCRGGRHTVLHD